MSSAPEKAADAKAADDQKEQYAFKMCRSAVHQAISAGVFTNNSQVHAFADNMLFHYFAGEGKPDEGDSIRKQLTLLYVAELLVALAKEGAIEADPDTGFWYEPKFVGGVCINKPKRAL
jgi:hypothetical protein